MSGARAPKILAQSSEAQRPPSAGPAVGRPARPVGSFRNSYIPNVPDLGRAVVPAEPGGDRGRAWRPLAGLVLLGRRQSLGWRVGLHGRITLGRLFVFGRGLFGLSLGLQSFKLLDCLV